jgi:hypothetical protein
MKTKALVIGGISAAVLLVSGSAFAQSPGHGPGDFGPPFMQGEGPGMRGMHGQMGQGMHGPMGLGMHGMMGRGMRGQMGPGMHGRMGPGRMGMMGMGHGSATMAERSGIHDMLTNHDRIKRTVTNLPNGIRTVTESDDPELAATIAGHVADMGKRVKEGRDPKLPIQSPTLQVIFRNRDKINTTHGATQKGIVVVQTSNDPETVAALQKHAAEVNDLVKRGMVAAHENMMKNGGMMHGAGMTGRQHRH